MVFQGFQDWLMLECYQLLSCIKKLLNEVSYGEALPHMGSWVFLCSWIRSYVIDYLSDLIFVQHHSILPKFSQLIFIQFIYKYEFLATTIHPEFHNCIRL